METKTRKLKIGDAAPGFTLPNQEGKLHSLSDYKGRWVLVYFYPKDDTPGCTREACALRDQFPKFGKLKAQVFGVSADSAACHKKFAQKFKLPFPLLADEQKRMIQCYGVWGEKKFMGRTYLGIHRSSFLIDPKGKIAKIYEKVKPELHAEEVLKDLAVVSLKV